jgi:sugar/nucleoside kinase (ribokinase family)
MKKSQENNGIICAGNLIVDKIKIVDKLPERGMLCNILSESLGTGGAPVSVMGDLAVLGAPFPLASAGIIGDDEAGDYICSKLENWGIDTQGILKLPDAHTSYTDVMTERSTGNRTFFQYHGANDIFSVEHIDAKNLSYKIFHLGYLALLGRMDDKDETYGTVAARLLNQLQNAGIKTSIDVVSVEGDILPTIVPPALKFVDYLILNEVEIGLISGVTVRGKDNSLFQEGLIDAVEKVSAMGNMEFIVVHMPEGSYMRTHDGVTYSSGSLNLPEGYIAGAVGAGDAFCAGMLYGIHEEWSPEDSMNLGACCSAASLSASDGNSGMRPLKEVLSLSDRFNFRPPPVKLT